MRGIPVIDEDGNRIGESKVWLWFLFCLVNIITIHFAVLCYFSAMVLFAMLVT